VVEVQIVDDIIDFINAEANRLMSLEGTKKECARFEQDAETLYEMADSIRMMFGTPSGEPLGMKELAKNGTPWK
jgi:hypothetical protein